LRGSSKDGILGFDIDSSFQGSFMSRHQASGGRDPLAFGVSGRILR
jgi:hypothetical protein